MGTKIEERRPRFSFEGESNGLWNPRLPELSHTLNGFQIALPYLEPYFMDAVRAASSHITDPALSEAVRGFCAQEANHSREHRKYCRFLRERYPQLAAFEASIQQGLLRSRQQDPLAWRLAYTAGYEAITAQLSRWLFRNASEWFRGASGDFPAMMTWHAAEELEHRQVAFDVLSAVSRRHGLRAAGLFAAMRKTWADMVPVVTYMLRVDGYGVTLESKARRLRLRLGLVGELLPAAVRYLSPGYHPSQDPEPAGFADWLRAQAPASSQAEPA
jgi:predicted metal-dependent hydrolase